jgi:rubrerythrin
MSGAGVKPVDSIEELEDRLALWCQIREPSPLVKHASVLELLSASLHYIREIRANASRTQALVEALERWARECDECGGDGISRTPDNFDKDPSNDPTAKLGNKPCQSCARYRAALSAYRASHAVREDIPVMRCPKCLHKSPDYDGCGVQHCDECGYCTHASITDGRCDLCGAVREGEKP